MKGLPRTTKIQIGLVGFLLGLVVAQRVSVGSWAILVAVVLSPLLWRQSKLSMLSIILIGVIVGGVRGTAFLKQLVPYSTFAKKPVLVRAVASSDAVYGDKKQLSFDVDTIKMLAPSSVKLPGTIGVSGFGVRRVQRGDVVEVQGKLYPARGSRMARISFAKIRVLQEDSSWVNALRRRFAAGLQSVVPEPAASLGLGILIGQRTTLPATLNDDLSKTSLTHIVAVSGYNLTIIVQLMRRLLEKRSKYQATIGTLLLIGIFLAITGLSASIVRAAIVSSLSLWAWYYGRAIAPVMLLLLAAVLTAGWYPPYLWRDLGWHLSFLAFFGVLVVAPLFVRHFLGSGKPHPIVSLIIETTSAQLMTIPVMLFAFSKLSLIALVANMLVVPLVPVAMAATFGAGMAAMLLPALAGWLAWPATILLTYALDITALAARLPWAAIELHVTFWQMLMLYSFILVTTSIIWKKAASNGRITERKG